ncbi:MAG: hypothetical protein HKO86_00335 [Gammaproteobacteria bacterium]|nr:hypothetical protein [Gammaproteobacteria bacterium]NNL06139.1 hypothetical protein [Gammaproteobacteria bacterium]
MRQFMISTLGAIFVLAVITTTANAANFTDETFGISIEVDDALSKQPLLRDIQYFKPEDSSGSLMIKRIHDLTIVDFLKELRDVGYRDMRDGIDLLMTGEPIEASIESGRGLLIPIRGRIRGQPITGVVGAYSGHDGQGFLVIGTAKPQYWAAWQPRMKTMFESIRFAEVDRKAIVEEWIDRLKGKKLHHKQANVKSKAPAGTLHGGAVRRDFHLCNDGTVMRKTRTVAQAAGQNVTVYGRSMQQGRGTWRVMMSQGMPLLIVRDGPEQEFLLEKDGDNFLLNGKPYIITDSDLCK